MKLERSPRYRCPCCGFPSLDSVPYQSWTGLLPPDAVPPYEDALGTPSYEVCACCGFEFGNDDNPGGAAVPTSFEAARREWAASGYGWFDPQRRPEDWNGESQLRGANLTAT